LPESELFWPEPDFSPLEELSLFELSEALLSAEDDALDPLPLAVLPPEELPPDDFLA
jgi:hypothetical protein